MSFETLQKKRNRICFLATELEEFAGLEGTELGEYWGTLVDLHDKTECMSEDFMNAYLQELEDQFDIAKNEFVIVEKQTTKLLTSRYLESK